MRKNGTSFFTSFIDGGMDTSSNIGRWKLTQARQNMSLHKLELPTFTIYISSTFLPICFSGLIGGFSALRRWFAWALGSFPSQGWQSRFFITRKPLHFRFLSRHSRTVQPFSRLGRSPYYNKVVSLIQLIEPRIWLLNW